MEGPNNELVRTPYELTLLEFVFKLKEAFTGLNSYI